MKFTKEISLRSRELNFPKENFGKIFDFSLKLEPYGLRPKSRRQFSASKFADKNRREISGENEICPKISRQIFIFFFKKKKKKKKMQKEKF